MKVGILSDSHDDLASTEAAFSLMRDKGCELIIHAGDICSPFTARLIRDSGIPHKAIFGNNDGDRPALARMLDITPAPRHIEIDRQQVLVFHEPFINDFIDPSCVDLLIYGHTHRAESLSRERMLIVNPGAACGILASRRSCAIYETFSREVEICEL